VDLNKIPVKTEEETITSTTNTNIITSQSEMTREEKPTITRGMPGTGLANQRRRR
jgi:hypothetical protein